MKLPSAGGNDRLAALPQGREESRRIADLFVWRPLVKALDLNPQSIRLKGQIRLGEPCPITAIRKVTGVNRDRDVDLTR